MSTVSYNESGQDRFMFSWSSRTEASNTFNSSVLGLIVGYNFCSYVTKKNAELLRIKYLHWKEI